LARLFGVDLPKNKRMEIALTYIYGIGKSSSQKILKEAGIDFNLKTDNLTDEDIRNLRRIIEDNYVVEGELRKEVSMNIKRLMDLNVYRGIRHKRHLPVRGQRTSTNARTRKGPRKTVVRKKK
jgi:small subunit ribosomal protein S13